MHRLLVPILLTAALSGCASRPLPPYTGQLDVVLTVEETERLDAAALRDLVRVQSRKARCEAAFTRAGASTRLCR